MKKIVSGILLVLLLVSVFMGAFNLQARAVATDTDWPMFHHDLNRTGTSTSTGPVTNNTLWNYTTGSAVESSPAVVGGLVYVGSNDNTVYCLNATNGAFVWNCTTGGYVFSSPAVVGGFVYVGSDDGNVYCLNAASGAFVWNYTTGSAVESSPAVVGGLVYVGSDDNTVYCLNATNGAFVWNCTTGAAVESSPAVVGGFVYVGSDDGNVYCLNAATGVLVWNCTTGGYVFSSPAVVGGFVYVGSDDGNIYCLNANTGAFVWSCKTDGAVRSSPAVAGGLIYAGCNGDGSPWFYCLNATNGKLIWNFTIDLARSSPAVAAGLVMTGKTDGVYCLNATTGTRVWNYATGDIVTSSPAVVNGVIYVGSFDGKVYAFGPSSTPPLTVSISPGSVTLDVGQSQLFTSTVSYGTSPYQFQWYVDGVAVGGNSTSRTFSESSSGSYLVYLNVTDSLGVVAMSNVVTVTVNGVFSVTISPTSVAMNVGQSQQFTSSVSGGTSPYAYQWYLNGGPISGATGSSWTFTPSSSGSYTIYINVTDNVSVVATSNPVKVTVNLALSAHISPEAATLDLEQSMVVTFTSSVSGTSPYAYQWYLNGVAVNGAWHAAWTFGSGVSVGSYTVFLRVTDAASVTATSNTATVIVNPTLHVIIQNTTTATLAVGMSQLYTSIVTGGTPPFTYQWYLNKAPISGAVDSTWTFKPKSEGYYRVYVKVTDSAFIADSISVSTISFSAYANVFSAKHWSAITAINSVIQEINNLYNSISGKEKGTLHELLYNYVIIPARNAYAWASVGNWRNAWASLIVSRIFISSFIAAVFAFYESSVFSKAGLVSHSQYVAWTNAAQQIQIDISKILALL